MCSYYFNSFWVAEWPPFGKELLTRLTICYCCILTIILVISRFAFELLIWVLIASVPGLCIIFTFLHVVMLHRHMPLYKIFLNWTKRVNHLYKIHSICVINSQVVKYRMASKIRS